MHMHAFMQGECSSLFVHQAGMTELHSMYLGLHMMFAMQLASGFPEVTIDRWSPVRAVCVQPCEGSLCTMG